jgi:hypothetical protein
MTCLVPPDSGRSFVPSIRILPRQPARKHVPVADVCTPPTTSGNHAALPFSCPSYLGAIVILISAMRQGASPRRVRELSQRFGADRRTIARWQVFWRERFPQTPFWKIARARLVPIIEIISLPYSLVDAFLSRHHICKGWTLLLHFLSPITIPGGVQIEVSR